MLIENVTGQPWASALRQDLLDPTGLDRVWVQDAEQPAAAAHGRCGGSRGSGRGPDGPWVPSRFLATYFGGAGGMAADAPSMARWGYQLYGGHVIDSALVEQMTAGSPGLRVRAGHQA